MSNSKKLIALTLAAFIALVLVSQFSTSKGDAGGDKTGTAANVATATNNKVTALPVPVTQVGLNQLADQAGQLTVSVNMTWLLICGFLVLFMQVGFAFLVTGLTRAKNAGHMMMMNIAAFAIALIAYYFVGYAFQFGAVGIGGVGNLGSLSVLNGVLGHGHAGLIGLHGFFLQTGKSYDVGAIASHPVTRASSDIVTWRSISACAWLARAPTKARSGSMRKRSSLVPRSIAS